jgi:hypothetical protein
VTPILRYDTFYYMASEDQDDSVLLHLHNFLLMVNSITLFLSHVEHVSGSNRLIFTVIRCTVGATAGFHNMVP